MKKIFALISLCMIAFNAVHAEITWTLSDDGTLTISGTDMPHYNSYQCNMPWYSRRNEIQKVEIENGVTNIGNCAFYNCLNLTSISIPNTVTSIAEHVFMYCKKLTSVTIPNSVTSIGGEAFYDCSGLTSITIPNSVISIGAYAFVNCSGLTSITIPISLTRIEYMAFAGCSGLTSITIPNSVERIEQQAFLNCSSLTSITCEASTPPNTAYDAFAKVNNLIPVFVPENSVSAYKGAGGWKYFENIQAIPDYVIAEGIEYTNYYSLLNSCDISYTRNFSNTKWQALYIPFSLRYDDWKDDFEVAYINGIRQYDKNDDGAIDETIMDIIKIKDGELIPNTPYLIKAKSVGEKTFSLTGATLFPAEENSIDCRTTIAEYTFTGTYSTIPSATLIANQYYAMGGGELIISDGSNDLKPYRWYMRIDARSPMYNTISNAAKAITINVIGEESETTGIRQLQMTNDKSPVYDLNGRRVSENSLEPGMYIKNGKKVIIR